MSSERRIVIRSTPTHKRLKRAALQVGVSQQALALILMDEGLTALESKKNPKIESKIK